MERRQVSIFINRKRIREDFDSIKKKAEEVKVELAKLTEGSKEYVKKTNQLKELNTIIDKHKNTINVAGREIANDLNSIEGEYRLVRRELKQLTIGQEEYNQKVKELQQLERIIQKHKEDQKAVSEAQEKLKNSASAYDKLRLGASQFIGIAAGAFAIDKIVDYGTELFKLGTEMETLGRKAETVFGSALPLVTAEAQRNATAMGLTASQYTDAATAMGDLLVPMGFTREETARLTTNTVNLSGALAEWTGGQKSAEEVTKILSKALLGEREELKQLGIAISEADVKARLQEKGIDKLTGKLLEQAKATATLELIIEKSADAQAAFAKNSDLTIRKQAQLTAQFQDATEKLATALLPVFNRLITLAIKGAEVLTKVADSLTNLFDPIKSATSAFDEQASQVASLESELLPLLTRYEQLSGKSQLSKEEQRELSEVIAKIGEITPTAITEIDNYGRALGINADKSRAFLEAEKARLAFVNKESISTIEKQIESLKRLQEQEKQIIETGKERRATTNLAGRQEFDVILSAQQLTERREKLKEITTQLTGAEQELLRLRGEREENKEQDTDTPPNDINKEQELKQAAQRQKTRDEQKKSNEKELQEQEQQYEKLLEALRKFQNETAVAVAEEDQKERIRIQQKFEEQIELAKVFEKTKSEESIRIQKELEALRDEQLQAEEEERIQKQLAKIEEREKRLFEKEQEVKQQLKEAADEVLLTEQEQAIQKINDHYQELLDLAGEFGANDIELSEKFGSQIIRLKQARQKEIERIEKESNEKRRKDRIDEIQKQSKALQDELTRYGNIISGILELTAKEGAAATAFSKVQAVAIIGIKSAEAIAKVTASAAELQFPANLAAIATAVGTVLSNIAQARKIISGVEVPQKKKGGYVDVLGMDDGYRYNAKYLGEAQTGMLPNYPVLLDSVTGSPVLASEAGSEYFVSNEDLKNPAVFNYVQAIENITKARQFVDGGATNQAALQTPPSPAPTASQDTAMINALLQAINRLNDKLDEGLVARYDDEEVTTLLGRISKLNTASGGAIS